ncbi:MAG TPA: universal stress protein [Cyclobacteriaceae bacterium]|nr:universal stress protein [Cyclobacteriaceae bacterium]
MNITAKSSQKIILCTIDFSPSTRHSLEWAVSIARQLSAHLSILYAYRLIQPRTGEIIHLKKDIEQEARQKFEALEKQYLSGEGISYDFKIEVGFVSDRIEDRVKKNTLDFVVINKTMHTSSQESFEELMDHVQVPVLVVP